MAQRKSVSGFVVYLFVGFFFLVLVFFTGFSQLFYGRLTLNNGSVAAMKLTATRQGRGLDMDLCIFPWVLFLFGPVAGGCRVGLKMLSPRFSSYPGRLFQRVVKGLGDPSLPFLSLLVFVQRVGVCLFVAFRFV